MLIALVVLCTLCEAVFTAIEVALGAVPRARLRALLENAEARAGDSDNEQANHRPAAADASRRRTGKFNNNIRRLRCLDHPDQVALVFIITTSLTMWTASALLTWQVLAAGWPIWTLPLGFVALLFVAEVIPVIIAAPNPEALALRSLGLLEAVVAIASPVVYVLGGIGHGLARLFGASPEATSRVTEGELRTALATAEEEGVIESTERAMLEGAMDFREKQVREVMTPRIDVVGVPATGTLREVLAIAAREGHSRLPVFETTIDTVIGIVAAKDLIPHLRRGDGHLTARDIMRPPYFVPLQKRIASMLEELRRQRSLIGIVVDSDGGTAGLVTIEDLLEEIVGEIQDEYDEEEPPLRIVAAAEPDAINGLRVGPTIESQATVTVRAFEKFWRRSFGAEANVIETDGTPADPAHTLAALALELFDGIPHSGDRVAIGHASCSGLAERLELYLVALRMAGPRLETVRIESLGPLSSTVAAPHTISPLPLPLVDQ